MCKRFSIITELKQKHWIEINGNRIAFYFFHSFPEKCKEKKNHESWPTRRMFARNYPPGDVEDWNEMISGRKVINR